ncbi:hypothetical protein [Streptomyces sp. AC627_RSS907]|uniref:hypothetical protein n=1 Tax=Streptomyces sp. AC627_RSS907 TaxID=2823684 RepID=UPI0020B7F663|nr:hypothetical protein [Streptomyces sp. AC627_RSS907]
MFVPGVAGVQGRLMGAAIVLVAVLTHPVRLVQFMCEQIEITGVWISVLKAFPGPGDTRVASNRSILASS